MIPRIFAPAVAAGLTVAVCGCQYLGPQSINYGRGRYNDIIHETSTEQTMSNIVRVYNHDMPQFMDVTEVDATVTASVNATGASSNIGATHTPNVKTATTAIMGQVGTAGGTITYSETPTIRYQPLLGQPLVAQLVTPVSADALGYLYDSTWDPAPLLDFAAAYLTMDTHEFYPALDTIKELHDLEVVELAAATTTAPGGGDDSSGADKKSKSGGNDALVFYLLSYHKDADVGQRQRVLQLWVRMLRLYAPVQKKFSPTAPALCQQIGLARLDEMTLKDWDVNIAKHVVGTDAEKMQLLEEARSCLPRDVALRIVPSPLYAIAKAVTIDPNVGVYGDKSPRPKAKKSDKNSDFEDHLMGDDASAAAPLMRTYSALGILKNATDRSSPRIEFTSLETYHAIRAAEWNADADDNNYYILTPDLLDTVDCPAAQKGRGCENVIPPSMRAKNLDQTLKHWLEVGSSDASTPDTYPGGLTVYEQPGVDVLDADHLNINGRLGTLRRYMLIVVSDDAPSEPTYVSYYNDGRYYSIMKDDALSQKNFQLLSLFMTMMAIPPSTQPLSPVINVGGN